MMKDVSELVAEYHYGDGQLIRVYACYASDKDYSSRLPEFFDCYDATGVCMNEGDPWYTLPTWQQCAAYVSPFISMAVRQEGGAE